MKNPKLRIGLITVAIIALLAAGCLLVPAFGASEEILGGNGSLDSLDQAARWTAVNNVGTGSWGLDTAVQFAGSGSGRIDSPEGADVPFDSYVSYRFIPSKVPQVVTLDLAYRKQFAAVQPTTGNWTLAVEIWEVGGNAPLQTFDIDTGTQNVDFTITQTQVLSAVTKMGTEYELRLVHQGQTGSDALARLAAWFDEVKVNITYDSTPPEVVSAAPPTDHSIDVTFNEKVKQITAENLANYSISPTLSITGAVLQPDGQTVRLAAEVQTKGTSYTVSVSDVQDISGNTMTLSGTAAFTGVDTTSPAIVSAVPVTDTSVEIEFSEPVDPLNMLPENFAITPALTVAAAQLLADGRTVQLTTVTQAMGTDYTVTADNVRDLSGNVINIGNSASFKGIDTTPPEVGSASVVNDQTVNVIFNEAMDLVSAQNTANYSVSPALAVFKAVLLEDGQTVQLTTEKQIWQTAYTLTGQNIKDVSGNLIGGVNTAAFTGVDTSGPELISAVSVNDTTVDIVFDEALDSASANNQANYSINPALTVSGSVLQADGKTVRLTTSIQNYQTIYTVTAAGVSDLASHVISGNNQASFNGADTTEPKLVAVSVVDYQTVDLVFSEDLESVSAAKAVNYSISPELAVNAAVLQPDGLTVRLTTAPHAVGTLYTVMVSGLQDLADNLIGVNNSADFAGVSPPKTTAPKVLSAAAPNNSSAAVVFDTTMDPGTAQNLANYRITPELSIVGAVLEKDGVTVRLSTGEQTAGTIYTVTVTNVQDDYGNFIGTTDNTAAFTGSAAVNANPHGKYMEDTNQCSQCHITHNAPGPKLLNQETQTQLCYLCHDAGGQSVYDVADEFGEAEPYAESHHRVPEGTQQCSDCHNPHDGGKDIDGVDIHWPKLLQSGADPNQNGGNGFCFSCHQNVQGTTRALDPAVFPADGFAHNNSSFVINGATPFNPASGSGIRCMGCHQQHGSTKTELLQENSSGDEKSISGNNKSQCFECHVEGSADGRYKGQSIYDNKLRNGHQLTTSSKTDVFYPGIIGQAGQCVNCHDPHGTPYGTAQVSMKSLRGVYRDGKTSYAAADFNFCFGCHNSTSADPKYDIQTPYNSPTGGHYIKTAGGNLDVGSKMACESCHTLHGSTSNKYMLKDALGTNLGDGRNECLACHQTGRTVEGIVMAPPTATVAEHKGTTTACLSCHGSPHNL